MQTSPNITRLLERWSSGEENALEELVPLVYKELRKLAANYLRRERHELTLQPTALINEVFLRLIDQSEIQWQSRAHFFGIAARLMRRILVDRVRVRQAAKRGGVHYSLSLSKADRIAGKSNVDLLALNLALHKLDELDPQQSRIVELRFFGGLTIEESAEVLSVSHATVERQWKMARAWLRVELGG
ncbi:MAG TPA: sigma-70 family RNA polymerase sigma factor [Pyrinomonadaceae bacterium]|nr:sigma-70 family RNA polymerase sigma factor [Pyrinomonadaceae bacterium]